MPNQKADGGQYQALALEAGRVFTPNTPINEKDLFAGRVYQVRRVVDAINQAGQHAIIFGERGVGKTSLGNVLAEYLSLPNVIAARINCDATDSFQSVWRKLFDQIELIRKSTKPGFAAPQDKETFKSTEILRGKITPDSVRQVSAMLSPIMLPIFIIDEFDRLDQKVRRGIADTIKNMADNSLRATIVMVGVGDAVDSLIEEHNSIGRNLVQIRMPRMSGEETREIIKKGLTHLQMTMDPDALERVAVLTQGLPHYAHLLGLHSVRDALDGQSTHITELNLQNALNKALEDVQQSIRTAYYNATRSQRQDNLFATVLLACALARTDELGYFGSQDVRGPMRKITGKNYEIPSFSQHLSEFSSAKRGKILTRTGGEKIYRYRFSDPLMQPFLVMKGESEGKVPEGYLGETAHPPPTLF